MRRLLSFIAVLCLSAGMYAETVLGGSTLSGNGWTGMDLGAPHVLSIIGWTPPAGSDAKSTQLGVFEGGNRADFMDALPLLIIDGESTPGQMNYARVDCSRGFRYVRYVASSGKQHLLPAIELWGDPGQGDDTHLAQLTNLPTVTIHTLNNELPYDKVHEIECFISIISNDGTVLLCDTAFIRERGNASRGFPKKPYRIKFAHKHRVLDAPANAKKWTLINNYGDKTLMRNQLAFELSRRFGMPYTPFCAYVDVLLNGDYKGCYQLCDQIEVRKNRVEITEMTPRDNSGEALTGGYFIEVDAYAGDEPWQAVFWSDRGTPVTIKSPDEDSITTQQNEYIRRHYNKMEAGSGWKTYLDLNTFLRHFLVGEVSGNTDTYWSMYLYKQRANDTLYVGPCWDFDLAFDNDNRTYHVNNLGDYVYRTNGSTVGNMRTLVDKIVVQDTAAKQQLKDLWAAIRKSGFTEESFIRYIDDQEALLQQSQELNFIRWPIMNQYVHQNPRLHGSYAKEVENVRKYMRNRIVWMDAKLDFDINSLDVQPAEDGAGRPQKILCGGQIYILRNGRKYTLTGTLIQ